MITRDESKQIVTLINQIVDKKLDAICTDGRLDLSKVSNGSLPQNKITGLESTLQTINQQLAQSIQGYYTDVYFYGSTDSSMGWVGGTIKFYDGTTQSILSGSLALYDYSIYYIYFDLDDDPSTLKVTTDYLTVMSTRRGLLCLTQKSSYSDVLPVVIPSYGKQPLITPDVISMTGLKNYVYGDGSPSNPYTQILTYKSTFAEAGCIKLNSETKIDTTSPWYNKGGVTIDATAGIEIYGDGILRFTDESALYSDIGMMSALANALTFTYNLSYIMSMDNSNGVISYRDISPNTSVAGLDLGASTSYWNDVHCANVVDHSSPIPDIDHLKMIKNIKINIDNRKIDKNSLPEHLIKRNPLKNKTQEEIEAFVDEKTKNLSKSKDRNLKREDFYPNTEDGMSLTGLVYSLVEAVKQLADKVEALEGGH